MVPEYKRICSDGKERISVGPRLEDINASKVNFLIEELKGLKSLKRARPPPLKPGFQV